MTEAKVKSCEDDSVIIEEEKGVLERKIEHVSPSKNEKRKREEDTPNDSPNKYKHSADGNRAAANSSHLPFLNVPFWKNINRRQSSTDLRTTEISTFSLLTHDNQKECFDDKRYLRSKLSS